MNGIGKGLTGKSVETAEARKYHESSDKWIITPNIFPRKPAKLRYMLPVPQTDTGSQVEYTKVLE